MYDSFGLGDAGHVVSGRGVLNVVSCGTGKGPVEGDYGEEL